MDENLVKYDCSAEVGVGFNRNHPADWPLKWFSSFGIHPFDANNYTIRWKSFPHLVSKAEAWNVIPKLVLARSGSRGPGWKRCRPRQRRWRPSRLGPCFHFLDAKTKPRITWESAGGVWMPLQWRTTWTSSLWSHFCTSMENATLETLFGKDY